MRDIKEVCTVLNIDTKIIEQNSTKTTEEYFNNNHFSIDAFKKKYTLTSDETYFKAVERVCDFISSVEKTQELRDYWKKRWMMEILSDYWHPAGSIMQGAGSGKKISLANCTTISMGVLRDEEEWDSLEAIYKNTAYTVAKTAAYRQGLGVEFSRLRPRGSSLLNSAKESTGAVHWMEEIDGIGYRVGQQGRIPAMLFSLNVKHPDIEEFVKVKSDYTRIQNANISVQITNDFYRAVEKDAEWELKFEITDVKKGDKVYVDDNSVSPMNCQQDKNGKWFYIATKNRPYEKFTKKVKAKKLLELIAKNMTSNAEPGIQNIDIARKYSNSDVFYEPTNKYDSRILSTNACSEQYLSIEGLCVLSSINAGKFSVDTPTMIKQLEIVGESINRFLDNVNECEVVHHTYATPRQKEGIEMMRRTGAGYTNLVAWLFAQNLQYGTTEANDKIEEFTKWYNYWLYISSEKLGKEKGNFGLFDADKWKNAPFVKRMIDESVKLNKKYEVPILTGNTMRNVTVSSIAPTGTLSLMFRDFVMSYGIEQAFWLYFWKRTRISGKYEYYFCVPNIVRKIFEEKGLKIPELNSDTTRDSWDGKIGKSIAEFIEKHRKDVCPEFKHSTEIKVFDKLELMSGVMKWIDSSISVTYLLPENADWKDTYNFILEGWKKEIKSLAAFPDRKMYGIVSFIPFKELALKLKEQGISIHPQNFSEEELQEINISEENIIQSSAPKRPKSLETDVYIITV